LGVIDYSCKWAEGQASVSTVQDAITNGMFFSLEYQYDPGLRLYTNENPGPRNGHTMFNLSKFLNDTVEDGDDSSLAPIDCIEGAEFLGISVASHGIDHVVNLFIDKFGPQGTIAIPFQTNAVAGIGFWPIQQQYSFSFHAISVYAGNEVFDVVAAPYSDPNGGYYNAPPKHWPLQPYWQSGNFGLVALPLQSWPFLHPGFSPNSFTPTVY
jgi:hypothetical protein